MAAGSDIEGHAGRASTNVNARLRQQPLGLTQLPLSEVGQNAAIALLRRMLVT